MDTVIVTGCVTSGCIRATVNDSFSHRFRTIVPEDCVGDHDEEPHRDNLRDMSRRYADVSDADTCIEYIEDWRRRNAALTRLGRYAAVYPPGNESEPEPGFAS